MINKAWLQELAKAELAGNTLVPSSKKHTFSQSAALINKTLESLHQELAESIEVYNSLVEISEQIHIITNETYGESHQKGLLLLLAADQVRIFQKSTRLLITHKRTEAGFQTSQESLYQFEAIQHPLGGIFWRESQGLLTTIDVIAQLVLESLKCRSLIGREKISSPYKEKDGSNENYLRR